MNGKNKNLENEVFLLENLYLQRENEIFNLECFVKKIKNYKKFSNDLQLEFYIQNSHSFLDSQLFHENTIINISNEKDQDAMIKKIIDNELEITKQVYQQTTKIALNEKKKEKEKKNQIEKLKIELENLKNPNTDNNSHMNNYNTMPTSNFTKTTNTIINENNTKNKADANCADNNQKASNLEEMENLLEMLKNRLQLKQNELNKLNDIINNLKSVNEQLSKQWIELNNELSEKFSMILKLEIKKEKLKTKQKKSYSKRGNYIDPGNIKNL